MDAVLDAPVYCGACGGTLAEGGHERCPDRLRFDPPRFCAACGFRLDVQVYPGGIEAWCRRCDPRAARNAR